MSGEGRFLEHSARMSLGTCLVLVVLFISVMPLAIYYVCTSLGLRNPIQNEVILGTFLLAVLLIVVLLVRRYSGKKFVLLWALLCIPIGLLACSVPVGDGVPFDRERFFAYGFPFPIAMWIKGLDYPCVSAVAANPVFYFLLGLFATFLIRRIIGRPSASDPTSPHERDQCPAPNSPPPAPPPTPNNP
mgnify:CR=1 FL=1